MTALRRRIRRRMTQLVGLLAEIPSTGTKLPLIKTATRHCNTKADNIA